MSTHEHIEQIRQDHLNGMTYKAIAEKYMIDQRTAKRYADGNLPLSQLTHRPYASLLDPYEPMLRSMLAKGPIFSKTIYAVLKENGYTGGYTIVNRRVQQIIQENELSGLYPPGSRRTRNIPANSLTLTEKIREETEHAANRI